MLEYDGTSGAIQRWYAYALGPNEVLNQMNVTSGTRAALVPDIIGSIIASQDSSSGALTKVGYLPYGKSPSAGPFGFTGQRIDVETGGFYYYRARHYSPAWGRFLQVDPIGYSGGVHLYAYVGNDPLNGIDPNGLIIEFVGQSYATFAQGSADEQKATTDYYSQHPYVLAATVASPLVATGVGIAVETAIVATAATADAVAIAAATDAAAAARAAGATGGATSGLVTQAGEIFTGASTRAGGPGMATNPVVQGALDSVAAAERAPFHGCCGEINAASVALNSGASVTGATVATVRAVGQSAGQIIEGCSTCQAVARQLGIRLVPAAR